MSKVPHNDRADDKLIEYDGPAGGWGSVLGMAKVLGAELDTPASVAVLWHQNKPKGFACTSCAWTKPAEHHPFEFCENGAKATLWELTTRRCKPDFFAAHTTAELRNWPDYDLEQQGRLTHPMRYDVASDTYRPCNWDEAFAAIGSELRALDPKSAVFYASGRASLETSYCYALFARLYGHNNLPDSSNMCHETTSVSLKASIGSPVGTVIFDDLEKTDAFFFFGQNTGSNSPRFLHPLRKAVLRGATIITFNPVRERGLERFRNPQSLEMVTGDETVLSSQYHQLKAGGDIAAIMGLAKVVLAADDVARAIGERVLDVDFIGRHTQDFETFEARVRATPWEEIERQSGLARAAIEEAGKVYIEAERVIGVYGMGLTQHRHGSDSIAMLVNLLMMRGHIGRDGAGICPVRGHSNVQGQRTVGISEKPDLVPLDKLAAMFGFEPPRDKGLNTVEACKGIVDGSVKAFIALGGNFLRAIPDRALMEEHWPRLGLTVSIATKLNRSHLFPGKVAYLLPCIGRTEEDRQASGPQTVTVEDSFSHIHGSIGRRPPASEHLRSELAIVAGLAKATLSKNPHVDWDGWTDDYAKVRALIEQTYPDEFHDFEARMFQPGGFYRGNAARDRHWKTESGKAMFRTPEGLCAAGFEDAPGRYRLLTMRSNDQFNTTIYGYSDRLRGIEGRRNVLLINPDEIRRAGLSAGERVTLISDADDGRRRSVENLVVTPFAMPDGCLGGYYPELNALIALDHHDVMSSTPAAKSVPVRIERS